MSGYEDLGGFWTGEYRYSSSPLVVRFSASIEDTAGRLTGTILEPNTFILNDTEEAEAIIDGERTGHIVTFSKRYTTPVDPRQPPLLYHGTVNAKFTLIVGTWRFTERSHLTGSFTMTRVGSAAERVSQNVAAEISAKRG